MDDAACPKCKSTKYRNPSMKLMVNVCGHALCESCVELLFVKGSGSCPECHIPLRRVNFRLQLFEDSLVDKEIEIRRRVLREFNKTEEDFPTAREYSDYQEMIEDIIFNLANNIDVQETNKQIADYKEANKNTIGKNRHKTSREILELEDILSEEKKLNATRRQLDLRLDREEKMQKEKKKQDLIDDLMFSDTDASEIVAKHVAAVATTTKGSNVTKILEDSRNSVSNVTKISNVEGEPFVYQELVIDFEGPAPPSEIEVKQHNFGVHVRPAEIHEQAAGYFEEIACLRSLQDAMSGLYFSA